MKDWNSDKAPGEQSDRVRLLNFLGVFAIGGTERHVVNLAQRIDRSKFELSFGCFRRFGEFLQDIESLGFPISEYSIKSLYSRDTFRQQFELARHLKRHRIQVVNTYGFYSTVFAVPAAKLARVPVIVASIRDTGETLTPIQKRVHRSVCRLADSILVNAEAVKTWLLSEGFRHKNIQVIRNGIALDRFEPAGSRPAIRQELGLPAHAPVVAMLGRVNLLKGVEYFLEGAALVSSRFPEVYFLIVGDAPPGRNEYREELKRKAVRLGIGNRVVFTGFRTDIPALFSEITMSVLPSLSEGLSNVLLESMAAGLPVVATRVGGNPEVVEENETGFLVPPADAGALARAMSLLLEKPELGLRFGAAGKLRVAEHFNLDRMVHQTEQHYLELLNRTAGGGDLVREEVRA